MNKSNIEWCDFTWNPMVGCKYGCPYCYAKALNKHYNFIPKWESPEFFPERLLQKVPKMPKVRNRIAEILSPDKPIVFVGSMTDLFGSWVDFKELDLVLEYVRANQQANFYFLTKNHAGYMGLSNFENCWFGMTVTSSSDLEKLREFDYRTTGKRFVSIEPLMGNLSAFDFSRMEFVLVGAMTGAKPVVPTIQQVKSIKHERIYYKNNILSYFPSLVG